MHHLTISIYIPSIKLQAASSRANRKDLILEQKKAKEPTVKKDASNSRKLAKAEKSLDERDMLERGEDIERNRNWAYSIEDSEKWEDKLERKEGTRDKGPVGE
jgi:pre-mRNA-splicing factor SYF2